MVFKGLDCRLGDQDVDFPLNCIEGNWVVSCVWGENGYGRAGCEGINGCLIRLWVLLVIRRVGFEGGIEAIVDIGDILGEMLAWIC